jgi:predicted metal-dependent hydrolase
MAVENPVDRLGISRRAPVDNPWQLVDTTVDGAHTRWWDAPAKESWPEPANPRRRGGVDKFSGTLSAGDQTKPAGADSFGHVAADHSEVVAAGTAATSATGPVVEVRRSTRRRRTVTAYRDGDRTIVLLPAQLSAAEEQRWVRAMLERLERREQRAAPDESELGRRCRELSERYFDGRARPVSVRWVANQGSRWGSCTPLDGSIRISERIRGMPDYVVDYVLLHELAHLLVPSHGPAFWALLDAYPRTERARGYLEGFTASKG